MPLERYEVLLLDMHSTFMFGEDRFGSGEDFFGTYASLGGATLDAATVTRVVRGANSWLAERYALPQFEDDFPSVDEALRQVAPTLPGEERELLIELFAEHERGTVPPAHADALRALSTTHELRLISNIWAPKARWLVELERAGVHDVFTRLTFSSDSRSMKPSRRLYEQAIEGVDRARSRILMIGDSLRADMLGGRRADLDTLWLASETAPLPAESASLVDYRVPSLLSVVTGGGAR